MHCYELAYYFVRILNPQAKIPPFTVHQPVNRFWTLCWDQHTYGCIWQVKNHLHFILRPTIYSMTLSGTPFLQKVIIKLKFLMFYIYTRGTPGLCQGYEYYIKNHLKGLHFNIFVIWTQQLPVLTLCSNDDVTITS